MAKERIEPTTYWLGNTKKFQAPARVRTHDLLDGKAISEVHFTPWSTDKVEFWHNLSKKRVTDHDFHTPFMWAENNNLNCYLTNLNTIYLLMHPFKMKIDNCLSQPSLRWENSGEVIVALGRINGEE